MNAYECQCGSMLFTHRQFTLHFMQEVHWAIMMADLVLAVKEAQE